MLTLYLPKISIYSIYQKFLFILVKQDNDAEINLDACMGGLHMQAAGPP